MLKTECCCSVGVAWGSPCEKCDRSVDCKECPPGQAKLDGKSCQDINECSLDPSLCAGGICINTEGSFTCRCPNGKMLFGNFTFVKMSQVKKLEPKYCNCFRHFYG